MSRTTIETDQDEFFRAGEGNEFFRRNRDALRPERIASDPVMQLLRTYEIRPASVVELGCANGWRLAALRREYGCRAVGLDASREAIEAGERDWPDLELHHGTLADSPVSEAFDLTVVHFVLHWNSRETLMLACANLDRAVRDGGYLVVGDFLPDRPQRRHYHHAAERPVYTYKQDYAELFLATGLYREVARLTFDADDAATPFRPDVDSSRRAFCSLLRKSLVGGYLESRP